MGLLSPTLLFLGLAAAVPIILHLFQRHQGPRVVFPALRYLRRAERESARRIRLRQLLLMLLRVGAVLLLALAAARPFARTGGAQHEPTAVAIVLDNSMSSGVVESDRRMLDALKGLALEVVERAEPDDRFWLIRAGAPWEPAMAGDANQTAERIRATEPTAAAADVAASLGHARALLEAGAEGRAMEIELLSDLQATGFTAAPPAANANVPLVAWVADGEAPANAAVASVQIGGGAAPIAGERSNVTAVVTGTAGTDSVNLRLALDGRIVAAAVAPAGAAAVLPLSGRTPMLLTGWVETDADALRADDRRYFTVRVRPAPAVALTGPAPFLRQALTVMSDAGRIRQADAASAEVAILPGGAGAEALRPGQAAILLPPESPLELPAANRRLNAAGVPWRIDAAPPGAGEARFDIGAGGDDLMHTLEQVRLTLVYQLTRQDDSAAGDTTLLRLSDGQPWAVRGNRPDGGRYLLLASPLSAEATTLPTTSAMVPLVDRLVGSWSAAEPARTDFTPGEEVALPALARRIVRPDGSIDAVEGATRWRLGEDAGIYRIEAADSVLDALAVNPPTAESDLARMDGSRLRRSLPGWSVETANDVTEWRRDIFTHRLGREIGRTVLLAGLLILLLEGLIAASGGLRRERAGARSRGGSSGERAVTARVRGVTARTASERA